jgi:hypothetical protein
MLANLPPAAVETLLTRPQLQRSTGLFLSEALDRQTSLGMHVAGSHGAWDLPFGIGPGTDRLSIWFDGLPTAGEAVPEALCHTLSPLLLGRIFLTAPDAFLDPLGLALDGALWGEEVHFVPHGIQSAVRLTEGAGQTSTQEVSLAPQAGSWRLATSFATSRSDGRPWWVQPRYMGTRSQNLRAVLDRSSRHGAFRVAASSRDGKLKIESQGKLLWESQLLSGGWQFRFGAGPRGQIYLFRRNDLLRWWGTKHSNHRRTTSTGAVLHTTTGAGPLTLLLACGAERVSLAFSRANLYSRDEAINGTGIATGCRWEGPAGGLFATIAHCDPWWGKGYLRGHLVLSRRLAPGIAVALEGWNNAGVPFTPRLEGDGDALFDEGLLLPGLIEAEGESLRRLQHGEARVTVARRGHRLRAGFFVRGIENAVGADPSVAPLLVPAVRDTVAFEDVAGDVTFNGAYASWRVGLPLGAAISGDATALIRPQPEELPVLVAPYRARAVLSIGGMLFKGDLHWEGRLIYQAQGKWTTPYGESGHFDRVDGEIHGGIGRTHFFVALRNLENETLPSATYVDPEWMPLLYRSYQAGIEWHFLD